MGHFQGKPGDLKSCNNVALKSGLSKNRGVEICDAFKIILAYVLMFFSLKNNYAVVLILETIVLG